MRVWMWTHTLAFVHAALGIISFAISFWNSLPLKWRHYNLIPKSSTPLFHRLLKIDIFLRAWTIGKPPSRLLCSMGALYNLLEWMNECMLIYTSKHSYIHTSINIHAYNVQMDTYCKHTHGMSFTQATDIQQIGLLTFYSLIGQQT